MPIQAMAGGRLQSRARDRGRDGTIGAESTLEAFPANGSSTHHVAYAIALRTILSHAVRCGVSSDSVIVSSCCNRFTSRQSLLHVFERPVF